MFDSIFHAGRSAQSRWLCGPGLREPVAKSQTFWRGAADRRFGRPCAYNTKSLGAVTEFNFHLRNENPNTLETAPLETTKSFNNDLHY